MGSCPKSIVIRLMEELVRKVVLLFLLCINIDVFSASISAIVPEDHYGYSVINDFVERRLLIAPEIYKPGGVLTRKDFAILSTMLLTNTDDKAYLNNLSYYDIKNILRLVVDFSEEINFFFSTEVNNIERRLRLLEKKIEVPLTNIKRNRKKIEMPDFEKRGKSEFKTRTTLDTSYSAYNVDNGPLHYYYHPERAKDSLLKTELLVESMENWEDEQQFYLRLGSWTRDASGKINARFKYIDPSFKIRYSSFEQDSDFILNASDLTAKYASFDTGRFMILKRMNSRNDVVEDIYQLRLKHFNVNYKISNAGNYSVAGTPEQKSNIFVNGDMYGLQWELGKAEVYVGNVKVADPVAGAIKFKKHFLGGLNIDARVAKVENLYNTGNNINSYRPYNTFSIEKMTGDLSVGKRFTPRTYGAVIYHEDNSDDNTFNYINKGAVLNINANRSYFVIHYLMEEEYDRLLKLQKETTDTLNFMTAGRFFNMRAQYNLNIAENETAYKGISRKILRNRLDLSKDLTQRISSQLYMDYASYDNTDVADGITSQEDRDTTGLILDYFVSQSKNFQIKADYTVWDGYLDPITGGYQKGKFVEGKFYMGMDIKGRQNDKYVIGYEYIDHSDKRNINSYEGNNLSVSYKKRY